MGAPDGSSPKGSPVSGVVRGASPALDAKLGADPKKTSNKYQFVPVPREGCAEKRAGIRETVPRPRVSARLTSRVALSTGTRL